MFIMGREEAEAVRRVIESKQLFRYRGGEGGETDQFEAEWAAKIGVKHAVAVTSGTAALMCGLVGLGIGPGDEVIVPAYTWMATAMAPLSVGAVPILAEVDETLTLDAEDVERRITPRTKAIIPVHMSGFPCDMDAIMAVAKKHNLVVLEDACQSPGGSYKGRRLGSMGAAGAFSFNHFKIIACGEGGATVTNDRKVNDRALIYHDVGAAFREHAEEMTVPIFAGLNFRMNEILSAVLRVQLGRLDGILEMLRREKAILREELSSVSGFSFNPSNDLAGDCGTILPLMFETPQDARRFIDGMKAEGIEVSSPIDSGRHVFVNWAPVVELRGAHHPALNPYAHPDCKADYSAGQCPKTLDYLARTIFVFMAVDRSQEDLMNLIAAIKRVAEMPCASACK
ncbi:MAG: DegT/DnrJ/EryC1/StrS family aminotransferase [Candidatus Hydrogenedentales bacterium]|jgi:dTDP-4-amino-4,6-dideoxygalactose transaminase